MASKSQPGTTPNPADPLGVMTALQNSGFGDVMGIGAVWAEAFSQMSAEFVDFLAERIKEDVKTQERILKCSDISELQRIQAEFVQTAIQRYQAETGRLMEIGSSAFSDIMNKTTKS